ncbi:3-dehydro-L-gulonate 2-dehydrogenase [Mucilaginibacter calamicampi]|uniref:3-dehydro-L-gulonate 2-dehydrogenase n=1 Tax=Mucilaginibacter calamicampi TaxID=1302352 RepID=A0ABW2YT23_9SPHI
MRIPFEQLVAEFKRILLQLGFAEEKADLCALAFAENSRDGVYTHGLNRFPKFVKSIKAGEINRDAMPTLVNGLGALERWDGNWGPGVINARFCMDRAITLAQQNGIACVALKNTNHWMRGGSYGWQAAEAGLIGICITNATATTVPWGGTTSTLGNNPLVIAVPRQEGHVVLDMAVSQYSYGKVLQYKSYNQPLPFQGGYDSEGVLTTDSEAVAASMRLLPIGFWKGSGLSMMLDLLVAVLSEGRAVKDMTEEKTEAGVSQLFIAIKPGDNEQTESIVNQIIAFTKSSPSARANEPVLYPGENTLKTRAKSLDEGVLVDEKIWEEVRAL